MPVVRIFLLTALTMAAFAGNSVLCRMALKETEIDAVSFTSIRLVSGAVVLWLIVHLRQRGSRHARDNRHSNEKGSWFSAAVLFGYASCFSFAYLTLSAATGALLLFGAVQATMIGYGIWSGERLGRWQWLGVALALSGTVGLFLPGLTAPPWVGALLMLGAGIAWGVYSLRGKGAVDPIGVTAGNFMRGVAFALLLSAVLLQQMKLDGWGISYAIASGAVASGLGYVLWYTVLPYLRATSAATVQLSVPVITAFGGVVLLGEAISVRLVLAAVAILGGIGLVVVERK
ncbi:MAG: EamA family transporter [Pseudomonadales bacterium]|nr:EamA family transporter [Pseudomonadales bacterium]